MTPYVLDLHDLDRSALAAVGGKAANLGELSRVEGLSVPAGFCVTTKAFRRVVERLPSFEGQLDALSRLDAADREGIRRCSEALRHAIEEASTPSDVASAIAEALGRRGDHHAYAVRSSATAEDAPTTSFAGQGDTSLNVVGLPAILLHVRRCWASLFTERAVTYRLRNALDSRRLAMGVVVQTMIFSQAAGVTFTAHPVSGHRRVSVIEACFGLGETLVGGLVDADAYEVRDGTIVAKRIREKRLTIVSAPEGGTRREETDASDRALPVLTNAQVLELERIGRRIEAHFGAPQDIEWCLADDTIHIVQSRPITTLFPIPKRADAENHVYLSVGHAQMMTDAMKPLGLSFWQLVAARPMAEAGGRLFVDVTRALASPSGRVGLLSMSRRSDPLTADALGTLAERGDFLPPPPPEGPGWTPPGGGAAPLDPDPAVVATLIARAEHSVAALRSEIRAKRGAELVDFILSDLQDLKRALFDAESTRVFMTAIESTWWLNDHLETWLGEKNAADALTLSVPNNVTSEMGLALLDVADVIRPYPEVAALLERARDESFLDELPRLEGGLETRDALLGWLDRYGVRCVGEIDITRPRWAEQPSALLPGLLAAIRGSEPGSAKRRFDEGVERARDAEHDVLERLRALPDGDLKAEETKLAIDRVRTFIGYREYPKYHWVSRYFEYKQALERETADLVLAGVFRSRDDFHFLTFQELAEVVRTRRADPAMILERRETFRWYESLTPPRVLTSDGESIVGTYRHETAPRGALVGLAVSSGTVEGRARVLRSLADADIEPGDILVTVCTDPSWTPLFVSLRGVVTEVGGVMTHGAVVAREYGLVAVVGVENATKLIRDGQRIRVDGTHGTVELLEE